jgi:hypothetical protein
MNVNKSNILDIFVNDQHKIISYPDHKGVHRELLDKILHEAGSYIASVNEGITKEVIFKGTYKRMGETTMTYEEYVDEF